MELGWPQEFKNEAKIGVGINRFGLCQLGAQLFERLIVNGVCQRMNLHGEDLVGRIGDEIGRALQHLPNPRSGVLSSLEFLTRGPQQQGFGPIGDPFEGVDEMLGLRALTRCVRKRLGAVLGQAR